MNKDTQLLYEAYELEVLLSEASVQEIRNRINYLVRKLPVVDVLGIPMDREHLKGVIEMWGDLTHWESYPILAKDLMGFVRGKKEGIFYEISRQVNHTDDPDARQPLFELVKWVLGIYGGRLPWKDEGIGDDDMYFGSDNQEG